MTIYTPEIEPWQQDLLDSPPRFAKRIPREEWEEMVLYELFPPSEQPAPYVAYGEDNGNYGNPTGYTHDAETRSRISKNHARIWLGKTGNQHPSYGRKRPDSVELAYKMSQANRGRPSWNKGLKGAQSHSKETRKKMSLAKKGKVKEKVTCPHCDKTGGKPAMVRFHFDNCKEKL
jgi:hypothetical protein